MVSSIKPPLTTASTLSVPRHPSLGALIDPKNFLAKANTFTGKLFFNLPLLALEHKDGSSTTINLTYNPLESSNAQQNLGLGWGLSKNCIRFDKEKNQYTLLMQGAEFVLVRKTIQDETKSIPFEIVNSNVVILLEPAQAKFRVFKTDGYSRTYEKNPLQDSEWTLSEETFPDSTRVTYSYEFAQKESNLKAITHSDKKQLICLSYNVDAVFKLKSVEIHSLNSLPANLDFVLTDNKISLVERRGQACISFSYNPKHELIESIALPTLNINFQYALQDLTNLLSADRSYSLQGQQPRIFYGSDYFIGAYIDAFGQLMIEKRLGETFHIEASADRGYANRYPGMVLNSEAIKSYHILPRKDILVVLLNGNSSAKIYLFNAALSQDSSVFQPVLNSWELSGPGTVHSSGQGFYFMRQSGGGALFLKKEENWMRSDLLPGTPYFSLIPENGGAWIYNDTALYAVDDLNQPLKLGVSINGVERNYLSHVREWSQVLSKDTFIQEQIQSFFFQCLLQKSGNYLLLSSFVVPKDILTPIYSLVQTFGIEASKGSFQATRTVNDSSYFVHENLIELSRKFFPNDFLDGSFALRKQLVFSKNVKALQLRTRNITILPDDPFVNMNIEEIDWVTGISYSIRQTLKFPGTLSDLVKCGPTNRENDRFDYKIKKEGSQYVITSVNQSLLFELNQGVYVFQFQNKDKKTFHIQPLKIGKGKIELKFTLGATTETLSATPDDENTKSIYKFITNLYNSSESHTEAELFKFIESHEDLPPVFSLALGQLSLRWMASIDDTGRVRSLGWEMTPLGSPQKNDLNRISDDYFLKQDSGQVCLYQNDNKKLFRFPVDSVDKIINFYPTCLAYDNNNQVEILYFKPSNNEKQPPQPDEKATVFRSGKLSPSNCYPFNPYLTLAIEEFSDECQQGLSIYKVPALVGSIVKQDWVISEQNTQSYGIQERTQFLYSNPSEFQRDQIVYHSFSKIAFDGERPQGKTVTTLSGTRVEKTLYDQDGTLVQTDQNPTQDELKDALQSPVSQPAPPISVTSTLMSDTGNFSLAMIEGAFFEEQEADFMSFESYETGRINEPKENAPLYKLTGGSLIQGWSLSGQQYLALEKGGSLSITYKPQDFRKIFSVGVWVRSLADLKTVSPLTVEFVCPSNKVTASGEIKNRLGKWVYLEALLSLSDLESEPGTIHVCVRATSSALDIDNFRFSPMGCPLKARVFDPLSRLPVGVLDSKGYYQKLIYANQQQVGIIQPDGSIQSVFYRWDPHLDFRLQDNLMPKGLGVDLTIQPANGFYEDGDPSSIESRWNLTKSNWQYTPSMLSHQTETTDRLSPRLQKDFAMERMGCYFEWNGLSEKSTLTLHFGNYSLPLLPNKWSINQTVCLLSLRCGSRFMLFANGQLVMDQLQTPEQGSPSFFEMEIAGKATLKNIMLFDNPNVVLQYKNLKGQVLQKSILLDEKQVQLTLNSYDSLGRKIKASLPIVVEADFSGHLLTYRGQIPALPSQVFSYEASPLSYAKQMGYSQTEYDAFPSQTFRGTFTALQKKYDNLISSFSPWIPSVFKNDAYTYVMTKDADGLSSLVIQNKEEEPVASYLRSRSSIVQNQFSYEDGLLTRHRLPRFFVFEPEENAQRSQLKFERTLEYTSDGQLHVTTDPDYGTDLMILDPKSSVLRFQVHYNKEGQFSHLFFLDYDAKGCVNGIGYHHNPSIQLEGKAVDLNNRSQLEKALEGMSDIEDVPDSTEQFKSEMTLLMSADVSQFSSSLEERGQLQSVFTEQFWDENPPVEPIGGTQEFFTHDFSGSVIRKIRLVDVHFDEVGYTYNHKKILTSIIYPTPVIDRVSELVYEFDPLQRVSSIRSADGKVIFAKYEYVGGTDLVKSESLLSANIVRTYSYNAANQLISIKDRFLEQKLTYTSNAFQENQNHKQLIASISFSANWPKNTSETTALEQLKIKLNRTFPGNESDVNMFIQLLMQEGYLDQYGFLQKPVDLNICYNLPSEVLELSQVIPILQQHPSSNMVSHQFAYEFANQLTKAKFIQEEQNEPLRFSGSAIEKFLKIDPSQALQLYQKLRSNFYVTEDGLWNLNLIEGLHGALSTATDQQGVPYLKAHPIGVRNLLLNQFALGSELRQNAFGGYYFLWTNTKGNDPFAKVRLEEARAAWNWLQSNGFIDSHNMISSKILSPKLHELVQEFNLKDRLVDLVKMVQFYQSHAIGESANDVWVFGEDANGNMSKYYVGSTRYHLAISSGSNQLLYILTNNHPSITQKHVFKHDDNGNVTAAPHIGIKAIHYEPYSNRPVWVEKDDGTILQFSYDAKGFRSLKRVTDPQGACSEIRYLRNEYGKVLSEWHINEKNETTQISYIHGPTGLVAFIRNGKPYTVLKDHEGSIRVVIDNKQKVAYATHYLPYGQKTHTYGDADLLYYGYIGQEYDKELGLYNLNARLYDPQLGRFYQTDPKRQYASPYIYAGNSPVSFQDPTGLFSWDSFAGGLLSGLEILGGIAVDVLSCGALAETVGGALLGAGLSGMIYTIESQDDFSWSKFGEEEGIGAAIGFFTAGFGSIEGNLIEKATAHLAENSLKRLAAQTALKLMAGSVNGVIASVGQTILENAANGQSWDQGLENAAWIGAITGSLSSKFGTTGDRLQAKIAKSEVKLFSKGTRSLAAKTVTGFAGDATGMLIVNAISGQPLDSGLWQAALSNAAGGVVAGGQTVNPDRPLLLSRRLKLEQVTTESNCLAIATFQSMKNLGILQTIKTPVELRMIAAKAMDEDLIKNPQACRDKFREFIETITMSEEIKGLSPSLQELVEIVRLEYAQTGKSVQEILKEKWQQGGIDRHLKNYIDSIKSGEVWGNFLELDYLGTKLNLKFRVNINGEKWRSIGPGDARRALFLHYTGEHYDFYHKQGFEFFSKKRNYVSSSEEHGLGAGKIAKGILTKVNADVGLTKALKRITPSSATKLRETWIKAIKQLRANKKIQYKKKGKPLKKAPFGPLEFAREVRSQPLLHEAANSSVLKQFTNQGGSYKDLSAKCSLSLLVEVNHMPPYSVVSGCFGYSQDVISCVSMFQEDHRSFPSTGRLGSGKLTAGELRAVKEAISRAKFGPPAKDIRTFKEYHEYLKSLFVKSDRQQSYANMMEIEMRVKYGLFGNYYQKGIHQAIDYALEQKFIDDDQAKTLKKI